MWLINIRTRLLEKFDTNEEKPPPYAILSHRWGRDEDEFTFQEYRYASGTVALQAQDDPKLRKLNGLLEQARKDGLRYVWIDTCCIDKTNMVELGEAINSMFRWYNEAAVCYAYLNDVPQDDDPYVPSSSFRECEWFRRGWTLQELLAPPVVKFFGAEWVLIGSKASLSSVVHDITGIPFEALLGIRLLTDFSVAQRMSWAARRETRKAEDLVYCLSGIFDVYVPLMYGVGRRRAFLRFQEEIMASTRDDSILAWNLALDQTASMVAGHSGALAPTPSAFQHCHDIISGDLEPAAWGGGLSLSSECVQATATVGPFDGQLFGLLRCGTVNPERVVGIPLEAIPNTPPGHPTAYFRSPRKPSRLIPLETSKLWPPRSRIQILRSPPRPKLQGNHHQYFLHCHGVDTLGLEHIATEGCDSWDRERALAAIRLVEGTCTMLRFRDRISNSEDFVVSLTYQLDGYRFYPESHASVCSRNRPSTELAQSARRNFPPAGMRRKYAENGRLAISTSLEARLVNPDTTLFIINLSRLPLKSDSSAAADFDCPSDSDDPDDECGRGGTQLTPYLAVNRGAQFEANLTTDEGEGNLTRRNTRGQQRVVAKCCSVCSDLSALAPILLKLANDRSSLDCVEPRGFEIELSKRWDIWLSIDTVFRLGFEPVEVLPTDCWDEDRALVALHDAPNDMPVIIRLRPKHTSSLDFVVVITRRSPDTSQTPSSNLVLCSREASLADLLWRVTTSPAPFTAAGANDAKISIVSSIEALSMMGPSRLLRLILDNAEWPPEDNVVWAKALSKTPVLRIPTTQNSESRLKVQSLPPANNLMQPGGLPGYPISRSLPGMELLPSTPRTSTETVDRETYEDLCNSRSESYSYQALNSACKEIRLLRILNRGTFEDILFTEEGLRKSEADSEFRLLNERTFVIKAVIEHFPLDSCPPFTALSYTWGDPTPLRPIFFPTDPGDVDCQSYGKLGVTENLFQALRQMRTLQGVDYLWADAICINQNDVNEKNWQVAQMWETYKTASGVFVWLGSGNAGTNALMDQMRIHAVTESQRLGGRLDDSRVLDACTDEMLFEFMELVDKSYWTRAWVRQEMSAKDPDQILFWYGRRMLEFQILKYFVDGLEKAARSAAELPDRSRSPLQEVVRAIASSPGYQSVQDSLSSVIPGEKAKIVHIFETWLRKIYLWGSGLQASDPKDLVYSLVSMTTWRTDQGREKMVIDYNKSTRQVYIEAAISWWKLSIWRNDPEDTLRSSDDLRLPSWVPDWRRPIRPVHLLRIQPWSGSSEHQYKAGNMLEYSGGYTIKPKRWSESISYPCFVYMLGFMVDRIQLVSDKLVRSPSDGMRPGKSVRMWIRQLNNFFPDGYKPGMGQNSLLKKFTYQSYENCWQVPIMNLGIAKGSIATASPDYKRAFELLLSSGGRSESGSSMPKHVYSEVVDRYVSIAVAACENRRFFCTESGLPGLGFSTVRPGDCVVVFPGLDVPLILREVVGTGYRIISDSYVQGIMYGETKGDVGPGGFVLKEFSIF
jgi:hypothetical protein